MERTLANMNTRRRKLSEHKLLWQELKARGRRLGDATFLEVLDRSLLQRARASISERLARGDTCT